MAAGTGRASGAASRRADAKGYMCLRQAGLDRRFPALIDSVLAADAEPVA